MSDSLDTDRPVGPDAGATEPGAAAAPQPVADSAAAGSALTLTPPAPVAPVGTDQATQAVKLDAATLARLDGLVGEQLDAIVAMDVHDPGFERRVADIRSLGDEDVRAAAAVSSRLLDKPVDSMRHGGVADASSVSSGLVQLRRQVEDLDPSRQGDLVSPRRILGFLPFGDRLRGYFAKYQSSQAHINAIITGLYRGQAELRRDVADVEQEKVHLWAIMERLRQYIYLSQKLDAGLTARIAQVEATDPARARVLQEDVLFYVRQKVQDLETQLAVCVQGYLSLDVIRRNDLELVKGVDRATTTTLSALRTAVVVAQALADQKLVLDQITALNTTTSSIIESTSVMLRQQSGAISEQAASSTVDLAKLQAAFDNIYATMDEIDSYRMKALDSMAKTADALSAEIAKSQAYVERIGPAGGPHVEGDAH